MSDHPILSQMPQSISSTWFVLCICYTLSRPLQLYRRDSGHNSPERTAYPLESWRQSGSVLVPKDEGHMTTPIFNTYKTLLVNRTSLAENIGFFEFMFSNHLLPVASSRFRRAKAGKRFRIDTLGCRNGLRKLTL